MLKEIKTSSRGSKNYRNFAKIEQVLKQTAKNYNLENALYRHKALKQWQAVASSFVAEAKEQTLAVDFKKGILVIACLSREVASKLRLLAQRIIAALNEILGKWVVYALAFEL